MKYRFSFKSGSKGNWRNPRGALESVLYEHWNTEELMKKIYNVKRNLIKKDRIVSHYCNSKSVWYHNTWVFSFSINLTPKEAYELGDRLERIFSGVRYVQKGCNAH